ncbi:MAG: allantoinase AllB [Thermoanaerobacteraceae bacterium]|nr:allantoinase AllB [Thermoanaerobacteraceae bacterium]
MDLRIVNGLIVTDGNVTREATIYVDNGKIGKICDGLDRSIGVDEEIDAVGHIVFPGLVDPHVHFDDPGFTQREDFETGTKSAAAGGVTTVIDMPCTSIPPVINGENLDYKLSIIKEKAYVDFAFWGGITPGQVENGQYRKDLGDLKDRGIVGVKFYTISGMETYPRMPLPLMDAVFRQLKELNLVCAIHAEDYYIVDFYSSYLQKIGRNDPFSWYEGRAYEAEPAAIWSVMGITEKVGNKLHIVHLSSKEGLNVVRWAKEHGMDVTVETCPQYLLFTVDDLVKKGAVLKTAPPVRQDEDKAALWEGLSDGSIDFISTDHAAGIYPEEKTKESIWDNYAGIPGIQFSLSSILTYGYQMGRITLDDIQRLMSENAAKRYGLYPQKGSLEIGADADFAIVDINKEWTVTAHIMESKGKYSPLMGEKMKGKVVKTIVRGEVVYDDEKGVTGRRGYGEFIKNKL